MMPPLSEMLPYLVSAGGVYAYFKAKRLREAQSRKAELDVESTWRQFYKDLISDMKSEIGELKEEVFMLRQIVESYRQTCNGCPNNKRGES